MVLGHLLKDFLSSKVQGETICPCLMAWLQKLRVKRLVRV